MHKPHLQDDDGKRRNDNNLLHFRKSPFEGHVVLVLLQHRFVVLGIARVVGKEVVEDAQGKADHADCQEHHSPALNAKGSVPA